MSTVIDLVDCEDDEVVLNSIQQPIADDPSHHEHTATAEAGEFDPREELKNILQAFESNYADLNFSYGGPLPASPLTSIYVLGVGEVSLPLQEADIARLKAVAEKAPFGKGFDTVHDVEVRDAWQIDARSVMTPNKPEFLSVTIDGMARRVLHDNLHIDADEMGVKAKLYKMLIYEEGGHFLLHKDTEKEPGMFATYLLHLPVSAGYQGGVLHVKQGQNNVQYDFSGDASKTNFNEVVFYADCEHELKRVERGWRVVLAFNLIWERHRPKQMMVKNIFVGHLSRLISDLKSFEGKWVSRRASSHTLLAIPLEHKYTATNFSFTALKSRDSLLAQALQACSEQFEIFLVLKTKNIQGSACDYSYSRSRSSTTPRHIEMEEEFDSEITSNWLHFNPITSESEKFNSIRVNFLDDIVDDSYNGIDNENDMFNTDDLPDAETFEPYTGNAGPTVEYWYNLGFIVIVPKSFTSTFQVLREFSAYVASVLRTVAVDPITLSATLSEDVSTIKKYLSEILPFIKRSNNSNLNILQQCHLLAVATAVKDMDMFHRVYSIILTDQCFPPNVNQYNPLGPMDNLWIHYMSSRTSGGHK